MVGGRHMACEGALGWGSLIAAPEVEASLVSGRSVSLLSLVLLGALGPAVSTAVHVCSQHGKAKVLCYKDDVGTAPERDIAAEI